jgi:hypothetical protein
VHDEVSRRAEASSASTPIAEAVVDPDAAPSLSAMFIDQGREWAQDSIHPTTSHAIRSPTGPCRGQSRAATGSSCGRRSRRRASSPASANCWAVPVTRPIRARASATTSPISPPAGRANCSTRNLRRDRQLCR